MSTRAIFFVSFCSALLHPNPASSPNLLTYLKPTHTTPSWSQMFDKKQVENVLDRILSAPSFDGASSTVKTIRKMLEAELNTTFSTEQKSWVKRKLTERMASMARVKDAEAATLIENQKYTVEERLMMMLGFTPVPNGMGAPSIGRKRSSSLSSSSSSSSSSTSSGSKRPRVAESLLER